MSNFFKNKLVVSIEQAVAAPYCTAKLADAGARVIKVERKEGDCRWKPHPICSPELFRIKTMNARTRNEKRMPEE